MKINWSPEGLAELCRRECFTLEFWKSLGVALLWSTLNLVIVFSGATVIRWVFRVHQLFSYLFLPVPLIFSIGWLAGWYHRSPRIRRMVFVTSGLVYLAALPLILLSLVMAIGFSSVR